MRREPALGNARGTLSQRHRCHSVQLLGAQLAGLQLEESQLVFPCLRLPCYSLATHTGMSLKQEAVLQPVLQGPIGSQFPLSHVGPPPPREPGCTSSRHNGTASCCGTPPVSSLVGILSLSHTHTPTSNMQPPQCSSSPHLGMQGLL